MARGANIVVSHQLDCPQNYLYLDTIYGGYPLIHNSLHFSDIGYYYPSPTFRPAPICCNWRAANTIAT